MLSSIRKSVQRTYPYLIKENVRSFIPNTSPFSHCSFSTMTNTVTTKFNNRLPIVERTHCVLPSRSAHVVRCRDKDGNVIDSKHVTERFMRLGNGVWIKRHWNYEDPSFFKIAKYGTKYIHLTQRHSICDAEMAKNLDKLVTQKFKKHRWTVSDPYAGYDEHTKFYYNPFDMPGINKGKFAENRARSWVRYQGYLKYQKETKRRQLRHPQQSNRQKPLLKNMYYH